MLKKTIALLYSIISISCLFSQNNFNKAPFWEETFSKGASIDTTYWNYIIGMRGKESEFYTNSTNNVFIRKGNLVIRALNEKRGNALCTSGRIHTQGKVSFLYGKLEIKAKCPTGKGIWPAIWLIPENPSLPFGEIDIIEYIDCWESKKYQINVHVVSKVNGKSVRKMYPKMVNSNVNKYHKYTLEWYKDRLVFLLDNKIYYEYHKEEGKPWPFDKPYYLILNVAYGAWGGSCGMDESIFPCEMKVDWIKYYKLKE